MEAAEVHPSDGRLSRRRARAKCRTYVRLFLAHLFSHVGLVSLVCGYAVIGAFVFEALETKNDGQRQKVRDDTGIEEKRRDCVKQMWDITLELNVLYEVNWTQLMLQQLLYYEEFVVTAVRNNTYGDNLEDEDALAQQWKFSGALLYSVTVITTIGYGNIAPVTAFGRIVTIFYALLGIPLMLICLRNIGDMLANGFKFTYSRVCCVLCRDDDVNGTQRSHHSRHNSTRPGSRPFRDAPSKYVSGSTTAAALTITAPPKSLSEKPPPVSLTLDIPVVVDAVEMDSSKLDVSPPSTDQRPSLIPSKTDPNVVLRYIGESSSTMAGAIVGASSEVSLSSIRVPIVVVLAFVSCYICLGAAIFSSWEKWSFLDGAYFCFITLSTIGFGDIVPGTSILDTKSDTGHAKLIICCVYLVLGLSIIAMSFNLVQEEVTAKCKQIGRNLGILDKDSDDCDD